MPMDLDSDSVGHSVDGTLVVIDSDTERAPSMPDLGSSASEGAEPYPLPQGPVSLFDEELPRLMDDNDGDDQTLPDSIDQSYPLAGLFFSMGSMDQDGLRAPGPMVATRSGLQPMARSEVQVIDNGSDSDTEHHPPFDCAEIFSPPRVGRMTVARVRSSVVLPDPFAPKISRRSPGSTWRSMRT